MKKTITNITFSRPNLALNDQANKVQLKLKNNLNEAGSRLNVSNNNSEQVQTFGNGYPMFETGNVYHTKLGYLLPEEALKKDPFLIIGHYTKVSLDWKNLPTFELDSFETAQKDQSINSIISQYQIFI